MSSYSVIEWFGPDAGPGHHCGYCDSAHGSLTHGMWGHRLQTAHYAQLLSRGWRRSGKFLYHPIMDQTCCPQYAIRLNVNEFKPSKSQKKVIRKMNKFLIYGKQPPSHDNLLNQGNNGSGGDDVEADHHEGDAVPIDAMPRPRRSPNRLSLPSHSTSLPAHSMPTTMTSKTLTVPQSALSSNHHSTDSETGSASTSPSVESRICKKPRTNSRRETSEKVSATANWKGETAQLGSNTSAAQPAPDGRVNGQRSFGGIRVKAAVEMSARTPNKISISRGNAAANVPTAATQPEHPVNTKHSGGEKSLQELFAAPNESTVPPMHRLELRLMRTSPLSSATKATLKEEYAVYAKYESVIHRKDADDLSERQFERFLINSPLVCELHPRQRAASSSSSSTSATAAPLLTVSEECLLGSYHQQYVLDGRIIAVDVIDILPGVVTSVYFFYDPDYSFLSLGTYSVLREIALVQELHQNFPDIKYISLGFYVHSCSKMQYKSRFRPSELLCPETYTWHMIDKCLPLLDVAAYQRFAAPSERDDEGDRASAANVLVFFQSTPIPYPIYQNCITQLGGDGNASLAEVRTYAKLVGRTLAGVMLLYREMPV